MAKKNEIDGNVSNRRFSDSTYASEGCHPSTELSDIGLSVKSPVFFCAILILEGGKQRLEG